MSELVQSDRGRRADRMSQRVQLLEIVADRILRLPSDRTARVGIDGVDGAGKTMFADELAQILRAADRPVIRASVDGFHHPKSERYRRGRGSPEGYFEDSYNYAALETVLLDPLSPGGSGRYRAAVFDHVTDMPVSAPERVAAPASILVLRRHFPSPPRAARLLGRLGLSRCCLRRLGRAMRRARRHVTRSSSGRKPSLCRGTEALSANMQPACARIPDDRLQRSVGALHRPHVELRAPAMLFMVIETFKDVRAIGERFKQKGRMLPDGVVYHASWVEPSGARCFQIMEAQDAALLAGLGQPLGGPRRLRDRARAHLAGVLGRSSTRSPDNEKPVRQAGPVFAWS